jgi:IS30 family transposase
VQRICDLRPQRWTGKQIAVETGVSPATVSRVLKRHGLNKLKSLAPAAPVRRYERDHPDACSRRAMRHRKRNFMLGGWVKVWVSSKC